MHPEKPIFKDGQVSSEAELHELLRLRRMERQPDLAAQLDEIANWLYDLLGKKGEKDVQGIVRAINNRCNAGSKYCSVAGLSTRTGTALWKHSFDPGQ